MDYTFLFILLFIILLVDIYFFVKLKSISQNTQLNNLVRLVYLLFSSFSYISLAIFIYLGIDVWKGWSKNILLGTAQSLLIAKIIMLPFFLLGDIITIFSNLFSKITSTTSVTTFNGMSRLTFIQKSALLLGSSTFMAFLYGIYRGAYQIKVNPISIKIPNLPNVFKTLKIVQISDLHVGSLASPKHLINMVEKINQLAPDYIFFTGDLVNFKATEVIPYLEYLKQLQAKKGIYSILGNHDYGMYYDWATPKEKQDNLNQLLNYQKELNWKVLMDEHELISFNEHQLAIIGIQYWGASFKFGKIGNLEKAYQGAEHAALQLLLSHDPSHWDKEVSINSKYKKIHATFSGHTHGFQFGVEIPKLNYKWSPSQYVYPHWAGLYQEEQQYLYVNRGMGYIGYPGRVGVPPEITVITFQ